MTANIDGRYTLAEPATLLWPKVITPEAYIDPKTKQPKGEPAYTTAVLFPADSVDFKAIKSLALLVIKDSWPGLDIRAGVVDGSLHLPWATGEELIAKKTKRLKDRGKEYTGGDDYQLGHAILKTTTKKSRPALAVVVNGVMVDLLDDKVIALHKSKFYSGVLGGVQINLNASEVDGTKFVTAYLQQVVSFGTGKQIGGKLASETFAGFAGKVVAEDPTKGSSEVDDEIPF
jgi:hypothetical protein